MSSSGHEHSADSGSEHHTQRERRASHVSQTTSLSSSSIAPAEESNVELLSHGFFDPSFNQQASTTLAFKKASIASQQTLPPNYHGLADYVEEEYKADDEDAEGSDSGDNKKKKKAPKVVAGPMIGFHELFRYGDTIDFIAIALGTVCALGHGTLLSMFTIIFGDVLDSITNPELINTTMKSKSYIFFYLAAAAFVASFVQVAAFMFSASRQARRIKILYFRSILNSENAFFDEQQAGEISSRLGADVMKIEAGMGDKIGSFLQFFATAIAGIIVGFISGWQLVLVLFATAPLIIVSTASMAMVMTKMVTTQLTAAAKAGGIAHEVLSLVKTVIAYGGENHEIKRYNQTIETVRNKNIISSHLTGATMGAVMAVIMATYGVGLYAGARFVEKGYMTSGEVMTTFFATLMALFAVGQAAPSMEAFNVARGAAYTVFNTIDREAEISFLSDEGQTPENFQGAIRFSNVSFAYKSKLDKNVISDFSIKIPVGQTVAFVGPSGCGKSTTISLLERFYDPTSGSISIDDIDIRDYNIQYLRSQIGYVSQMPTLFAMTIAENIALGAAFTPNPNYNPSQPISATRNPRLIRNMVTQEQIEEAAKLANAYAFIKNLPDGFNTVIGERGAQLSGGQKQRIAIARALIRNPKILLLDEATSALDTQSEKVVQEAIDRAATGRTTIVIAHRLSTVQDADNIAVVDGGRILEFGPPAQLYEQNGLYTKFVNLQAIKKTEEGGTMPQKNTDPTDLEDIAAHMDTDDVTTLQEAASTRKARKELTSDELEKALDEKIAKETSGASKMRYILRALRQNLDKGLYLSLGCFAAACNGVVWPLFSLIFSKMIVVLYDYDHKKVLLYGLLFLGLGLGYWLATYLQTMSLATSGEHLTYKIRSASFTKIMHQQAAWFDRKENSVGILVTRLGTEADLIKGLSGTLIGSSTQFLATILAALIIAFTACPILALSILGIIPIIGVAGAIETKLMVGFSGQKIDSASGLAAEIIDNRVTVAGLAAGNEFVAKYDNLLKGPMKQSHTKACTHGITFGISEFVMYALWGMAFLIGGELMKKDKCDFEGVMTAISSLLFSAMMLGQTMAMVPDLSKALVAAAKVYALLDAKIELDTREQLGEKPSDISGNIEFRNIAFNYPTRPDVNILTDLCLSIESGKALALVGESGCGKSTLIGLTERFYTPKHGSVYLDGIDVTTLDLSYWRSQIGLVSQEPDLFTTTVRENIIYGNFAHNNTMITQEQIDHAAKLANAYDFIKKLPKGYDTHVGERGTKLSGGQRQRIAIARALLRNPKILLLDEATSALDSQSEKIVQDALDRAATGRTTIVIAHRLSTIQNADKIAFIKNGVVVEQGTHDELMRLDANYATLVKTQQKKD